MSMQDRIVYDSNELIQILEGSLDRFRTFRFDHKYRELLGDSLIRNLGLKYPQAEGFPFDTGGMRRI